MLNFLFIIKYKCNVEKYIKSTYKVDPVIKAIHSIPNSNLKKRRKNRKAKHGYDLTNIHSDNHTQFNLKVSNDNENQKGDLYDSKSTAAIMSSYLNSDSCTDNLSVATNLSFSEKLLEIISKKNLSEPNVYKLALMDRRLFSKIISNKEYKPAKDTVLALIFAMQLDLNEANDLLDRAGFTLSHSIKRDVILEYFIKEGVYNLNNINAFLFKMQEKIIGR